MVEKSHNISWIIKDEELNRIKSLNFKEYQYGSFIHVGSVPFYLEINPKGHKNEGNFETFLFCNASHHNISKMRITFTVNINEINFNETHTSIYTQFPWGKKTKNSPKWDDIKNLNKITINITFKIINIWDNNNNIVIKSDWNTFLNGSKITKTVSLSLNKNEINKLNEYKFKQKLNSNDVFIGKIPFCIQLYPKGLYNENYSSLYLNCDAQGLNILKMDIWYQIKIPELGYTYIKTNEYYNFPKGFGISTNAIKSDKLLSLNDFTIDITFQILSITNTDGNIIPHNSWHKYIRNTNDKKPTCVQPKIQAKIQPNIVSLKQEIILLKANNKALKGQIAYMKATEINELKNENALLKERLMENDKQIITLKYEYDNQITNIMQKLNVLDTKYNALKQLIKKDNEVLLFLKSINMGLYYHLFCEQGFDNINDLKYITKDMLNDMGIIKMAHYSKILAGIKQYTINNANGETSSY